MYMSVCIHTHAHTHMVDLYHLYCITENGPIHTCSLFPMTAKGSPYLRKDAEVSMESKFMRKE